MKSIKQIVIILFLAAAMSCTSSKAYLFTSFKEPATEGLRMLYSEDGYHWKDFNRVFLKPQAGKQKIIRDPSMLQGPDGTFHLVWTTEWKGGNGFGYASSRNLQHWSEQQYIPVMQPDSTVVNVWAPELFYDDVQQQYVIVWASTIPYRYARGIEDEDNNHRLYCTTTRDFKNFTPARLFFNPGYSVIDAQVVQRGSNDYVLVFKDNTRPERDIKVAFATQALGNYSDISAPLTAKLTEGPAVLRNGKEWLLYFDSYGDKKYKAIRTTDFKTFTDVSSQVQLPEGHKHGTVLMIKKQMLKQLLRAK